jgi:RNA polymerase sigma-70 factor (ECF subfamily)
MPLKQPPAPENEADAPLVARARRGDHQAFATLVARWQRPVFARALRSARNVEDADDLAQETFVRAWQGLDGFRDDGSFGAWVLRILANLAADRGRRRARETLVGEQTFAALPDQRPDPEDELLAGELATAVRDAFAAIPPGRRREVFRMRFVEGRSVQEIADGLGVHSGTVKVHLFRLSRELRRRLTGREE